VLPTEDPVRSCSALAWSPDDQQLLSASNCRLAPGKNGKVIQKLTFQLKRVAKLGDQLSVPGVSDLLYIPLFWRFAKGKLQLSGMRSCRVIIQISAVKLGGFLVTFVSCTCSSSLKQTLKPVLPNVTSLSSLSSLSLVNSC
jgi:hypothetical protein